MGADADILAKHLILLVRLDERTKKLDRCMVNHLRHHEQTKAWRQRVLLAVWTAAVVALAGGIASGICAWLFARMGA